jgi:hypothetical protein
VFGVPVDALIILALCVFAIIVAGGSWMRKRRGGQ